MEMNKYKTMVVVVKTNYKSHGFFLLEVIVTKCSNYLLDSATKKPIISSQLLERMIDWMTSDPRLALTSIHQTQFLHSQRSTLWTSPTKPNTQTPIPGLVRWCTKAPLMMAIQRKKSVNCLSIWSLTLN